MEEKIYFKDLVARCSEFMNGHIEQEELSKSLEKLFIRFYIPMKKKIEIIQDIFYESYFVLEPIEYKIQGLEKAKILKGFLGYFNNLEYEEDDRELINKNDDYTYEVINQVLYIGSPELVKLFERDYNSLCRMVDTIVMQGDLNALIMLLKDFDTDVLKEENKKLRRTIKDVTKNKEGQQAIADLLELARFNDPATKRIIETEALENMK